MRVYGHVIITGPVSAIAVLEPFPMSLEANPSVQTHLSSDTPPMDDTGSQFNSTSI